MRSSHRTSVGRFAGTSTSQWLPTLLVAGGILIGLYIVVLCAWSALEMSAVEQRLLVERHSSDLVVDNILCTELMNETPQHQKDACQTSKITLQEITIILNSRTRLFLLTMEQVIGSINRMWCKVLWGDSCSVESRTPASYLQEVASGKHIMYDSVLQYMQHRRRASSSELPSHESSSSFFSMLSDIVTSLGKHAVIVLLLLVLAPSLFWGIIKMLVVVSGMLHRATHRMPMEEDVKTQV